MCRGPAMVSYIYPQGTSLSQPWLLLPFRTMSHTCPKPPFSWLHLRALFPHLLRPPCREGLVILPTLHNAGKEHTALKRGHNLGGCNNPWRHRGDHASRWHQRSWHFHHHPRHGILPSVFAGHGPMSCHWGRRTAKPYILGHGLHGLHGLRGLCRLHGLKSQVWNQGAWRGRPCHLPGLAYWWKHRAASKSHRRFLAQASKTALQDTLGYDVPTVGIADVRDGVIHPTLPQMSLQQVHDCS